MIFIVTYQSYLRECLNNVDKLKIHVHLLYKFINYSFNLLDNKVQVFKLPSCHKCGSVFSFEHYPELRSQTLSKLLRLIN